MDTVAIPTAVRVTTLGDLQFRWADGRRIGFPTRKVQALLVYLAMKDGQSASREELSCLLWERSAEAQARASLRQALSAARRKLSRAGVALIQSNAERIWLAEQAFDVDARRFDNCLDCGEVGRLEEAVASYNGEFLVGFELRSQPFEEWLGIERRRLRARLQQALTELLDHHEAGARSESALACAERLLSLDALDERAYRARMRINAGLGRNGVALECYEECRSALREELGIDPSESTRRLYEQILAGTFRPEDDRHPGPASLEQPPSIAVLPFRCLSAGNSLEYIAEGLAEDITTHLARMPGFLVISRTSTLAYRGKSPTAHQVGNDLGVRYLVEGTLRQTATGLTVTVQLTDCPTDSHLWADRIDGSIDTVLAADDSITRGILARIDPALRRAEFSRLERRLPADLDAWALYRRATGLLSFKGWHEASFAEAAGLLRRSIELDGEFAHAHAYLALVLAIAHLTGLVDDSAGARNEALSAAERALSLDSQHSVILGYVGCALADLGHVSRGLRLLERAVEYDPSNAQAWSARGAALVLDGQTAAGVESLRHGMRISPLDSRLAVWGGMLARALIADKRIAEAVSAASKACQHDDKMFLPRVILAAALMLEGRLEEARTAMEDAARVRSELSFAEIGRIVGARQLELMKRRGLLEPPPSTARSPDRRSRQVSE